MRSLPGIRPQTKRQFRARQPLKSGWLALMVVAGMGWFGPAAAAILSSAAVVSLAAVSAQSPATAVQNASLQRGPFSWPWEVSFERVQRAMSAETFRSRQVRRALVVGANSSRWVGVQEELVHAGSTTSGGERFSLTMTGVEGKTLSEPDLARRQHEFSRQAGSIHEYQSFRVVDSAAAASNYRLSFLGLGRRAHRVTYRFATYAIRGDRSAWILDLDMITGYPLYCGEYDLAGQLVSELEVTEFQPLKAVPTTVTWWKPHMTVTEFAKRPTSAGSLGVPGASVPASSTLPAGFDFELSRIVEDPLTGAKQSVLVYTDGVDRLFVVQSKSPQNELLRNGGHAVGVFQSQGMTQCLFVHRGVSRLLVGRGHAGPLKLVAQAFYAQLVQG